MLQRFFALNAAEYPDFSIAIDSLNIVIGSADINTDIHIYVLDITLINAQGAAVQPNGSVTVKIQLPEDFEDSDTYYVYYQADDGTLTDMHATFENSCVVFTTNHFSTYILTTEKLVDDSGNNADNPDKNQATGVTLLFIPAVAAAAGVIISKKRK